MPRKDLQCFGGKTFVVHLFHREAAGKAEKLPAASQEKSQDSATKAVAFAPGAAAPPESVMPDLKVCMDEISFNTVLAKKKKRVRNAGSSPP